MTLFSVLYFAPRTEANPADRPGQHGFVQVAAVSPRVFIGDPQKNALEALRILLSEHKQATVVAFPELSITGYTAEDLFLTDDLLSDTKSAIMTIALGTARSGRVVIVGAPYRTPDGRLFNAAFVLFDGQVVGAVPKTYLPNYAEFYERRWFDSGHGVNMTINDPNLGTFAFGTDQLFKVGSMTFGIEICEDLWGPNPPNTNLALAGAQVIFNLSASNEIAAKAGFRRQLVAQTSARLIGGYVYVSSGPTESTKDLVFGGHSIIAEDGGILAESQRFVLNGTSIVTEIDIDRIQHERSRNKTWGESIARSGVAGRYNIRQLPSTHMPDLTEFHRQYSPTPFVPRSTDQLAERAQEILDIQATGLARRMLSLRQAAPHRPHHMVIGVSGGLDSTLAILVAKRAVDMLAAADPDGNWNTQSIVGVTMPGFGTTSTTRTSADDLMAALGVQTRTVPIVDAVLQEFRDVGHDPNVHDTTFENLQARDRTMKLFTIAGQMGGIVVGTGDLSELCLGWCTYNGDHMSSYNVNSSIPKTLVRHLVDYIAQTTSSPELKDVLQRILATKVSPELLPPNADGTIAQESEDAVGPYDLNDFFIYHALRNGFGAEKIYFLANRAFAGRYDSATVLHWLKNFYRRFAANQFKRTVAPGGPKVGSVSTSPRGDLRLPDELSCRRALERLEAIRPDSI